MFYAVLRDISVSPSASHPHLCRAEVATSNTIVLVYSNSYDSYISKSAGFKSSLYSS